MKKKILVVGLGYVGVHILFKLDKKMFNVYGYDKSKKKISELRQGIDSTLQYKNLKLNNKKYFSIPSEAIFNTHQLVNKSALVKIYRNGRPYPAIVIERKDHKEKLNAEFRGELKNLALMSEKSSAIVDFFVHKNFPVDVRHNIKIDRKKLWSWAQSKVD